MKHSSGRIRVGALYPALIFVFITCLILIISISASKQNQSNRIAGVTTADSFSSAEVTTVDAEATVTAAVTTSVYESTDTVATSNDEPIDTATTSDDESVYTEIATTSVTVSSTGVIASTGITGSRHTTASLDWTMETFMDKYDYTLDDYPDKLLELLERNPDAEEFVMYYPLLKDKKIAYTMDEYENCEEIPLLLQWDTRWGYLDYGGELMGLSGCGPTALSMVAIYLLQDTTYDPVYIANYSLEHGYRVAGSGTSWSLMEDCGTDLGLTVDELTLDERQIIDRLEKGDPVICVVGPGDFTDTGHFLVLTAYKDGMFSLNDPNSPTRSHELWSWDTLSSQIRNIWAFSV